MRREVAADLKKSSEDFIALVWPAISLGIGGGDLIPVESVTANHFTDTLDRLAGIDAWIVQQNKHVFGLASRVQWIPDRQKKPWNTFTVRMKRLSGAATEYEKRRAQIATPGSLYPKWTCQGYISAERHALRSAAIADTSAVISAVTMKLGYEKLGPDGVRFWCVPWRSLWDAGSPSLRVYVEGHPMYDGNEGAA